MLAPKNNLETRCQSRKRGIIQSNIYRSLPKVIRSPTPWTQSVSHIMILAQAVLQIFCWQGSIGLQFIRQKREIVQPNIYRNLPKVNQVTYTLDTICVPNIMILAQTVLQIFCWQGSIGLQCISWKKGKIQPNIHRILRMVNQVICIMYPNSIYLISWSYLKQFFRYFVDKIALLYKTPKSEKGDNATKYSQNFAKS